MRERGWLMRIWDAVGGVGEPIDTAQNELAALREASSEDVWLRNAQARSLRLQELLEPDRPNEETIDAAHALYNQIIADAPTRPEGYYGNGTLSLLLGDREGARQWMQQALAQNGRFFPARLQLIAFAEEDQNWLGAVEHLEVLAEQYPARSERMYLTAASLLRRSGPANFARAQQLLGTLIDNEATSRPTRVAALVERGRLYRDMNETDLAIQVLERAQNLDDDSARAAFELGQIFAQQRNFEQAEEQFLTATNGDNGIIRAQAHLAIAELYASEEALNQPDDARDHFEQALDAGVDDPDALIRIGDSLRRFDRISSAAEAFLRADTLQESADPLAALRLAQVYLDLGELEDARTYAQRARELARDAPDILADALVVLGDVQRLSGDFVSAVNLYNQALEANVNQMHAALGLGFVAIGRDQWPVALSHFKNAVEMPTSEDRVLAHFWYAEALLRLGRLAEARQQYAHALALEPEMPEALLGLAQLAYRRNNLQEAEQFLEAALDQREEYAEALLFKGRLLYEQDQFDAALDALNRSIAANEEIGEAYYRRALVLMVEHENVERALDDLQRAVQLDPSDEESFYWLGRAYLVDQDYEEALQAFQEAIRLRGGNYAEARFYQGLAEEALDLIEQARNSFDAVIQTASDSELVEMANTALQRITP
jgi:tetratricopeptide (TPR) repeat protein